MTYKDTIRKSKTNKDTMRKSKTDKDTESQSKTDKQCKTYYRIIQIYREKKTHRVI